MADIRSSYFDKIKKKDYASITPEEHNYARSQMMSMAAGIVSNPASKAVNEASNMAKQISGLKKSGIRVGQLWGVPKATRDFFKNTEKFTKPK